MFKNIAQQIAYAQPLTHAEELHSDESGKYFHFVTEQTQLGLTVNK